MDIWTSRHPENAAKVASVLRDFGFNAATREMLSEPDQIIRMGVPPLRLEILTSISGVDFEDCYARRELAEIEEILVPRDSARRSQTQQSCERAPERLGRFGRASINQPAFGKSPHPLLP